MTDPLQCTERELGTRLRALQMRLNDELGFADQRLRISPVGLITGHPVKKWELRSSHGLGTPVPRGLACKVEIDGSSDAVAYLGYSESWVYIGGPRKSVLYRYHSSNLQFLLASGAASPTTLQVRLEWAGRDHDHEGRDSETLVFPGRGAAHPHWQVDLHEMFIADGIQPVVRTAEIDLSPRIEEVDLDEPTGSVPYVQHRLLPWFHKLHLPARAMWHEDHKDSPRDAGRHQHEPESGQQIDNWVLSAVRYLRNELSKYS